MSDAWFGPHSVTMTGGMIGRSAAFVAAVKLIQRYAACDAPVVIEGETGTGKELAARGIHYGSERRAQPFVPINCGALPEALIENELFGHCRGAFTDARAAGVGLIRLAHRGTLFLDEIDTLPARGQVGLLRFLQDGCLRPLGGGREEHADVRIIAASNRSLDELVGAGTFREDLLFRLRVLSLEMPPLRSRVGDPLLLADHFLQMCQSRYGGCERVLDADTEVWFDSYSWPGNVRQLENLVHRGFVLSDGPKIRVPAPGSCLPNAPVRHPPVSRSTDAPLTYSAARKQVLDTFDHEYLVDLLQRTHGNVTHAARIAGKERRALGKLLKKRSISSSAFRS